MKDPIKVFVFNLIPCLFMVSNACAQGIFHDDNIEEHAAISLGFTGYKTSIADSTDTIPDARKMSAAPLSYILDGSYSVYCKQQDLRIPVSFHISEQHRTFRQPFNQFAVNPTYKKWFKGYLGYNNLTWSPFTLGGATFLGIGIDLNPGKLRLGAMFGQFNKAIKKDVTNDPTKNVLATYSRTGYTGKIGYGTEKNHADLIVFHAKDDSTSLSTGEADSTLKPQENLSMGITSHQAIGKKLTWDFDVSGSTITRDLTDTMLNQQSPHFLNSIFYYNVTTSFAGALQTSLFLKMKRYSIKLGYRRIDPEYLSFGAYYFPTDIENFSIVPKFNFLNNKIRVSINAYYQHNNLHPFITLWENSFSDYKDTSRVKKKASTMRTIRDINTVSWNVMNTGFKSLGIDFQNSVFTNKEVKLDSTSVSDTTASINMLNLNFGITPYYTFTKKGLRHSISLVTNLINSIDHDSITRNFDNGHTLLLNAMYSVLIDSLGLTLSISGNSYTSHIGDSKSSTSGGTIGAGKKFLKDQINTNVSLSVNLQGKGLSAIVVNADGSYSPTPHHQFSVNLNYINSRDQINPSFYEFKIDIAYAFKF